MKCIIVTPVQKKEALVVKTVTMPSDAEMRLTWTLHSLTTAHAHCLD